MGFLIKQPILLSGCTSLAAFIFISPAVKEIEDGVVPEFKHSISDIDEIHSILYHLIKSPNRD
ncbi:MAG: hypothetical protein WA461_12030 [Nitrososphaeraceae archaeon]